MVSAGFVQDRSLRGREDLDGLTRVTRPKLKQKRRSNKVLREWRRGGRRARGSERARLGDPFLSSHPLLGSRTGAFERTSAARMRTRHRKHGSRWSREIRDDEGVGGEGERRCRCTPIAASPLASPGGGIGLHAWQNLRRSVEIVQKNCNDGRVQILVRQGALDGSAGGASPAGKVEEELDDVRTGGLDSKAKRVKVV